MTRTRLSPASCCSLVLILLLWCTGCAVRLIADYDAVLDQNMTSLQQSTEVFLTQLTSEVGTPAALYANNADFYVKTQATLKTIETRVGATPKSTQVITQIQVMEKTFADMQTAHQRDGSLSKLFLDSTKSSLESQFTSITTLEIFLKNNPVPANALAPSTK